MVAAVVVDSCWTLNTQFSHACTFKRTQTRQLTYTQAYKLLRIQTHANVPGFQPDDNQQMQSEWANVPFLPSLPSFHDVAAAAAECWVFTE